MSYEFKVEDVEYVRHGDTPQLARLYRPQGRGPFPIMVELHGGAWSTNLWPRAASSSPRSTSASHRRRPTPPRSRTFTTASAG